MDLWTLPNEHLSTGQPQIKYDVHHDAVVVAPKWPDVVRGSWDLKRIINVRKQKHNCG
jgi:hypothetical protein